MKKTNIFFVLISLLAAVQLSAQCRLVRTEASDTSNISYFFYDKEGRLTETKNEGIYEGIINKLEHHFAYNNKDKVVSTEIFYNDTLVKVKNFIYEGDVMKQVLFINIKESVLETGQLFYNSQGQLSHFFSKKTNGDTFAIHYEYAPEGWMKRATQKATKLENNFILENNWDAHQRIIDEPFRIFFAGYSVSPLTYYVVPIESLSVKGNWKGSTLYKMDKEGKPVKGYDDEVFDIKGNAAGLWIENKYRSSENNKIVTYRAVYEGCKN